MSAPGGLRTRLLEVAAVTALVGTRVWTGKAAQGAAVPYVVITQIREESFKAFGSDVDVRLGEFQLDCWGSTAASALAVGDAVLEALDRFEGVKDGTTFQTILFGDAEGPTPEKPDYPERYRRRLELSVFYHG